MATQRLGDQTLRKLSKKHGVQFTYGHVEHNHVKTLRTASGIWYTLYKDRLQPCFDLPPFPMELGEDDGDS